MTRQGLDGLLWTMDSTGGLNNTALSMDSRTSPRITALPDGGYQVAYRGKDGNLAVSGAAGTGTVGVPVAQGAAPSIVR